MDDAYGYWLSGLIDGEGCFRIHMQKRRTYYVPAFNLKLRDDDLPLLEEIRRRTGIGTIARDLSRSGNSNPCAIWRVQNLRDLAALVALLDRYPLRSRKSRDYALWREAVAVRLALPRGNRWHGPRDWARMAELKEEIQHVRLYKESEEVGVPCG